MWALKRLKRRLDAIDIEILGILASNCRVEISTIAKIVGLSTPAVRRRLRYLEESGILGGCIASIDATSLGAVVAAVIFYTERPEAIEDLLKKDPYVERLYYSSGRSMGVAILKIPTIDAAEKIAETIREEGASRVDVAFLDKVLIERGWRPTKDFGKSIIYRCRLCGVPIVGSPYIVKIGDEILIFTNKKCADAYFALQHLKENQ